MSPFFPLNQLLSMINEHEQVPEHNNELEQVIRSGEGHIVRQKLLRLREYLCANVGKVLL